MLRQLFGGAISCLIPSTYVDASTFRQVPDHQEVYVNSQDDTSFIVEIVEIPQDQADREHFSKFYFDELASDNAAKEAKILSRNAITPPPAILAKDSKATMDLLQGEQSVAKFNTAEFHPVAIWLGALRLPSVNADILVSWNDPTGKIQETQFKQSLDSFTINDWSLFPSSAS